MKAGTKDTVIDTAPLVLPDGRTVFVPVTSLCDAALSFLMARRPEQTLAGVGALILGGLALFDLVAAPKRKRRRKGRRPA